MRVGQGQNLLVDTDLVSKSASRCGAEGPNLLVNANLASK